MNAFAFGGWAGDKLGTNAVRLDRAFAHGLRPPPRVEVSDWAAEHRKFPDDSAYPGPWRHEVAPYLVEMMDCLSPHAPGDGFDVMKCAQSGGTAAAENWIGYISDVAPGPLLYVQATITAAKDWLAEKFWPMVEATPRLNPERRGSIMARRARDGHGTTALRVRFRRGGWMLIAGANSAATLRQHSCRYAIEDDLDQFPDDLDNQGSPEAMVDARLTVFRRQGLSVKVGISTPTNKGASKIGRRISVSDKRRYYLQCQHCASMFDPVHSDLQWPEGQPQKAELIAPCCGSAHAHWQKPFMSRVDGWLATVEIDGEAPARVLTEEEFQAWRSRDTGGLRRGYHITGLISAFVTWADYADSFVKSLGDVNKLRTWTNLIAGDEFVLKGDAPPAEDLEGLREQDWDKLQLPWGPTVFTLGADIQGDGIYFEALGWGYGLENWSLDHGFLPGPTDIPGEGAWALLETYARRTFVLPGGKAYGFDYVVVDAGYNTDAAKAFCRRSPRRLPTFGRDGWTRPILGRGQAIHYQAGKSGRVRRKKKAGEEAHEVGTFGAKYSFYGFLRASIAEAQAEAKGQQVERMRGRIHFGRHATPDYFDQLTSEACVVEVKAGQPRRVWRVQSGRQNHWLDCRVQNRVAAEALGLDARSEADWNAVLADRYAAADPNQGDLIALANRPVPAQPAAASATPPPPPPPAPSEDGDWVGDTEGWIR